MWEENVQTWWSELTKEAEVSRQFHGGDRRSLSPSLSMSLSPSPIAEVSWSSRSLSVFFLFFFDLFLYFLPLLWVGLLWASLLSFPLLSITLLPPLSSPLLSPLNWQSAVWLRSLDLWPWPPGWPSSATLVLFHDGRTCLLLSSSDHKISSTEISTLAMNICRLCIKNNSNSKVSHQRKIWK